MVDTFNEGYYTRMKVLLRFDSYFRLVDGFYLELSFRVRRIGFYERLLLFLYN